GRDPEGGPLFHPCAKPAAVPVDRHDGSARTGAPVAESAAELGRGRRAGASMGAQAAGRSARKTRVPRQNPPMTSTWKGAADVLCPAVRQAPMAAGRVDARRWE